MASPQEIQFQRNENNFFVPAAEGEFLDQFETLMKEHGLELEKYPYTINRSIYFFRDQEKEFPIGLTIRYRDYVSKRLNEEEGENLECSDYGSFELKWTEYSNGEQTKKKIKIYRPFVAQIALDELLKDALEKKLISQEELATIEQQIGVNEILFPHVAVDYCRKRYSQRKTESNESDKEGNVVSIDTNIRNYKWENGNWMVIGEETEGAVCEFKESESNINLRLKLYRLLVNFNAERFLGKKGSALTDYELDLEENDPNLSNLINEKNGFEYLILVDQVDFSSALENLVTMYKQFLESNLKGFKILDSFSNISSHGNIYERLQMRSPENMSVKEKLISILRGKYRSISIHQIENNGLVLINEVQHESAIPFNRSQFRSERSSLQKEVKKMQIRRSFWLKSNSGRVYRVSMIQIYPHPIRLKSIKNSAKFEIKYVGLDPGNLAMQSTSSNEDSIVKELNEIYRQGSEFITTSSPPLDPETNPVGT